MQQPDRFPVFQRMLIIITPEEAKKALDEVFDTMHIPMYFQCRGQGTAPSELMDIFGLRGTTRLLTTAFLPKFLVRPMIEAMGHRIFFRKRGGGIAITIPISGIQSRILQMFNDEARERIEGSFKGDVAEMKAKAQYAAIWVSVASGYSDDVIDAARSAGARGGTVLKGRRRDSEHAQQFFGISIQEEQDFVMVVVPTEKKAAVMTAISNACGLTTEAHGVVLSLPVDEAFGLEG
ncbi:transcriptional regulator [uncultured Intestinimonas sp.]|uniref:transcriptional regulator n=1 Tax=uncultured Intestinimonas sp. TaxID=1689265 RepID=UPI002606AFAD|nr:transcriptional regulator [uncultured Intestinimonas sp.]